MLVQYKDKWSVYNYTNQSTKSRAVLDLIQNNYKAFSLSQPLLNNICRGFLLSVT